MYNCILWGDGFGYSKYINLIRYQEVLDVLKIIGITSNSTIYKKVNDYLFIPKEDLSKYDYDFIIIMAENEIRNEIAKEAKELGIEEWRIISCKVFELYEFDMDKYLKIKKCPPTILANNCWGGLTYKRLNLKFMSPLINVYESERDYLKFLKELERYLEFPLKLEKYDYDSGSKKNYPICSLGDIRFHFNHDDNFSIVKENWERRKKRINLNNLFVMMYTENLDIAQEFLKLNYNKKICFVPFKSDEECLCQVEYRNTNEMKHEPFWNIVNGMARGVYKYYDVLDLIGDGKVTKIYE